MKKIFILVVGIVTIILLGIALVMSVENQDITIVGNNITSYNFERGIKDKYYDSLDNAVADIVPKSKEVIMEENDQNVTIVFAMEKGTVSGYEILHRKDGKYEFIGERKTQFVSGLDRKKYSGEETFKADLSVSFLSTYRNLIKLGEKYEVIPAWGISESADTCNFSVDGISVSSYQQFQYDNMEYYLWFIADVSQIDSMKDVTINN